MGQVLNTEGSLSSDESQNEESIPKKKKQRNSNAVYNKLKRDLNCDGTNFVYPSTSTEYNARFPFPSKTKNRRVPDYWEEAVAHANEAHQQEILGNFDVSFAMYKTAIVCLLSGVQGDNDVEHRTKVKELTSQYLLQAEWIYTNHLVFQNKPSTPKFSRIPWRSRSQLKRYKVISVLDKNLLVNDVVDDIFAVIKGILKSSCPLDRSEICVLPKDVPYMVKLLALHETETTVFFVLEHIRYGKLWDHLEHYFTNGYIIDHLDTEVTCASPQEKDNSLCSDHSSVASSESLINDQSLSRLESSLYTDTMSCESLSSHDENYFDLIEDYARAKSQKLKEIQNFNERRMQVESLRPVKKTISQVDLKLMDESYEHHRSQSLTDLAHEDECFRNQRQNSVDENSIDDGCKFMSDEESEHNDISTSIDMDTQQLLRNAQRLIESINETLSKNENLIDEEKGVSESRKSNNASTIKDICDMNKVEPELKDFSKEKVNEETIQKLKYIRLNENPVNGISDDMNINLKVKKILQEVDFPFIQTNTQPHFPSAGTKDENFYTANSPISESIPSVTEEYSVTAMLQRSGITSELIKKWAAQILVAVELLHENGILCRDLNPNNILLANNGSVKLTYFYRYPNVDPSLNSEAVERLYVAPEVNNVNSSITFAADWWSYGAILYELITLQSLHESHPAGISTHTILSFPEKIEIESKSLLTELLRYDPNERLGSGISGADDIKAHPYFHGINWEDL